MTDISPIGASRAAYGRATPPRTESNPTQQSPRVENDSFEISTTAKLLGQLRDLPEVRTDLIDQAKANIASGHYDSDEVIDQTVDKLAEDL